MTPIEEYRRRIRALAANHKYGALEDLAGELVDRLELRRGQVERLDRRLQATQHLHGIAAAARKVESTRIARTYAQTQRATPDNAHAELDRDHADALQELSVAIQRHQPGEPAYLDIPRFLRRGDD